jgi:hypothetical protein
MKAWALLVFAGITSLLIANELAYSAKDVLSEMYVNIEGVFSSNQYEILSSGFTTLGIVCIVVAIGLFLSIEKQSQNHTN